MGNVGNEWLQQDLREVFIVETNINIGQWTAVEQDPDGCETQRCENSVFQIGNRPEWDAVEEDDE